MYPMVIIALDESKEIKTVPVLWEFPVFGFVLDYLLLYDNKTTKLSFIESLKTQFPPFLKLFCLCAAQYVAYKPILLRKIQTNLPTKFSVYINLTLNSH